MIRNLKSAAAVGMLAAGLVASVTTTPAEATKAVVAVPEAKAGDVKITNLGINAPGTDTKWNRNKEFVWLTNVSAGPVNVLAWKLRDGFGPRYSFWPSRLKDLVHTPAKVDDPATDVNEAAPEALALPAGHSIVIYTGAGSDTTVNGTHSVYLDLGSHYINNTNGEDLQVLTRAGSVMDRVRFSAWGINPTP